MSASSTPENAPESSSVASVTESDIFKSPSSSRSTAIPLRGATATSDDSQEEEEESVKKIQRPSSSSSSSDADSTFADLNPNETRRILNEMIEQCQELDEKSVFQAKEDMLLREQVKNSKVMFEMQFTGAALNKTAIPRSSNAEQTDLDSVDGSVVQEDTMVSEVESRPSHLLLSYKHTQICASLVHKRTKTLGTEDESINLDAYFRSVRKLGMVSGIYSPKVAMEETYKIASSVSRSVSGYQSVLGSFEFKSNDNSAKEKPVKKEIVRTKRTDFDFGSLIPTQETVNKSPEASKSKSKTIEETSTKFQKQLKKFCKDGNPNVFEFTLNKDSIQETLNNTFSVAFGVRDGYIALNQDGTQYNVAATEPPQKDDTETDMGVREQCIISVSAAQLRKMQEIAMGENAIKIKSAKSAK